MSELPKGWLNSKLSVVGNTVTGNTPPRKNPEFYDGNIPFVKPGDIDFDKELSQAEETLSDLGCGKARVLKKGSVLVTCIGNIGRVGLATQPMATNQQINSIEFDDLILPKYAFYYCRTLSSWLKFNASATTVPIINKSKFSEAPFKVAPLAEQKRIVEKLDEVLAQVDTIKARLDGIPDLLKRFRQSVLASAVSGKLTDEWRELNKPSFTNEEFRDAITEYRYQAWLNEKQKKYEEKGKLPKSDAWKNKYVAPTFDGEHLETLPNGWIQDVLEGLVYISARIGWKGLKASEYTNEGPLFLSVHGLNHGTYVELSEAFHISEERYLESPEIMLKNDDILLCKDGAGIGKIAIVKGLDEKASINSSLLLIRAGDFFDTKFLYYLLSGPKMQSLVHDRMTGSAVPHLFQRDVKEFILDVPPLIEQKEIVRLVDQYFAFAETIEAQVKKAQAKVDNLTQSILAKAFRGELVSQDPSDEPADKLLERIAKAREEAEALAKAAKKAEAAKKRAAKATK